MHHYYTYPFWGPCEGGGSLCPGTNVLRKTYAVTSDHGLAVNEAWMRARARARRSSRLKVHAAFIGLYLALGLFLVVALPDIRPALLLWAVLFLPFFALVYYLAARTGWDAPKDFVCPSCQQFAPFEVDRCPRCGYGPSSPGVERSQAPAHARKVPKP